MCPGGGYSARADPEGWPVAELLNSAGISALVLNYRVAPYKPRQSFPTQTVRFALQDTMPPNGGSIRKKSEF